MEDQLRGRRGAGCGALWVRWRALAGPSLFFAAAIYYEELFLKLYCFQGLTLEGLVFTALFTLPMAVVLGLVCAAAPTVRAGRRRLLLATGLVSLWIGAQTIYYHLFKTFLTIFSVTKMAMVAGSFGDMAAGEILYNWFPVLMMALPVWAAWRLRRRLLPDQIGGRAGGALPRGWLWRWLGLAAGLQAAAMLLVLLCGGGSLSLRYIYYQTATPDLEAKYFGILTQTQLEVRRVVFGIDPDREGGMDEPGSEDPLGEDGSGAVSTAGGSGSSDPDRENWGVNALDIDFPALIQQETDEGMREMHTYFSQVEATEKNEWTGYFAGKNLVWIVAEGFSTLAMDPQRTPTLWKLSHEGFVFENFYTPLWGVSTSDGEYVTTTGLIPKSGVWSYSQSADNYMPFALGNQFSRLGYTTMAFHDYLYTYYDRDKSYPNMGYDYYAIGNGLEMEEVWPPSDLEMMEEIVPRFVEEEQFMVYCLTVSGHLNYSQDENAMSKRHYDAVADLPYSEGVKCYLASQIELELAVESLIRQLSEAGRLEDTVIVLSADHYPYGLTDQEYSELLGHPVDPNFEIYENTLILWNSAMEEPVEVEKYCSSLDVLPTLSNLFGLEYDSRLMAGRDILSDTLGLVVFSNYSFITRQGAYNATEDTFTTWDGTPADKAYVSERIAEVQNRVAYSAKILDSDYYRAVFPQGLQPSQTE